ncbi:MAG TPA: ThiF family adenylyltransferase [Patescibacteria group bacterium]|nr:ThiF family adenylyltransferase [Patescibacteria group bacterium]
MTNLAEGGLRGFISDNKEELAPLFREKIDSELAIRQEDFDVLDVFDEFARDLNDVVIEDLLDHLRGEDHDFMEDPNAILHLPIVEAADPSQGKTEGEIGFEDLWKRSSFEQNAKAILQNSTVGFAGMGGMQLGALILARSGIGNIVLSDFDHFESSNANRQTFCYSDTLGLPKAEVTAEYLKKVNVQLNVRAEQERITSDKFDDLFHDANVIVDTTGDFQMRHPLQQYARDAGKPIISTFWAGWEGQIATFMPSDPLYSEVFTYSGPTWNRGVDTAGISLMDTLVARNAMLLLLGDERHVVRYPDIYAINLMRKNPVQVRNVIAMKGRNERQNE